MKKLLSNLSKTMLATIVFTICILPSAGLAEDTLAWKTFRLAGYFNAPDAEEKGIADKILDYYIRHLPEYRHKIQEMPIVRLFSTMPEVTEGGYLCPGKTRLPPEQLKNVLASTIHLVMPPPGIVIRKTDLDKYFSGGQNVSIIKLLNGEKKIVCAWIRGGTLHPNIRKAVEDYVMKNENHMNVYFKSHQNESVLKMLMAKRIDYYCDHPIAFQNDCASQKACPGNIAFIGVSETQEEDVYTYTFAAKTKIGNDVISKINTIHNSEEYKKFLRELIPQYYPSNIADIYIQKNMELVGKEMR